MLLLGTGALALLALGATSRPAEACFQCTSSQVCVDGPYGASCTMSRDGDGKQWCQHTLDCEQEITMTPLEVSPSGTYLASGGARVKDMDMEKQECNGFVVRHLASDETNEVTDVSIRI